MKFIIIYFTISITSILRDYVDTQCSLYKHDILPMLFLTPVILAYCTIEKAYNYVKSKVTND